VQRLKAILVIMMNIIWYTDTTSPSPQWRLCPLPAALRSALSNLIVRGIETPADSAARFRASQLACSAGSVRIHLDDETLLERSVINEVEDDEFLIGDGVLPPPRFRFFDIILRSPSLVRFESPLVSSQRAEAFVVAMTEVADSGEKRVYNVDPIDAQVAISDVISAAVRESDESQTDPHIGAQIRAYSRAANTLHAQRQRVAAGGEPWSRVEQLAKLAMLRTASEGIVAKKVRGELSLEETAVLDAVAAGDAAMAADGEDCE
jgi:hypothetical protein